MKKKKAAAKAKGKAKAKPKKAKAPKAAKPSRGDAAADAVESIAIGIASAVGAAVAEGIGMAMRSVAAVQNNAVTYERTEKTEPATPPPETTELAHNQSCVLALGQATGALSNPDFLLYLNDRGITADEIGAVRNGLVTLSRAFYVEPEAERE